MSKIRVVQYINQFFAQIGGEEKADIPAELREGPVGPGLAFNQAWGADVYKRQSEQALLQSGLSPQDFTLQVAQRSQPSTPIVL